MGATTAYHTTSSSHHGMASLPHGSAHPLFFVAPFATRPAPPPPTTTMLLPRPTALSQSADRAYALQSYDLAHELYSEAIDMADREGADTKARLLANRAAALMSLGRNKRAIRDCGEVSFCCCCGRASRRRWCSRCFLRSQS